ARGRDTSHEGDQGHCRNGALCRRAEAAHDPLHDPEHGGALAEAGMKSPALQGDTNPPATGAAGAPKVDRDAGLVERLRRQEPGAAEALVAAYGDRVYRLAIRITGNEQDAEEVMQDALWTAARKIDTFKGESAFGSWLYRITANAAYQKLRSRQGR